MISSSETIFAPATAPGRAALAIVRMSGPAASHVCRRLTGRAPPSPRRAGLRRLRDPKSGETWSGRGRMASWLAAKVKSGEKASRYLIK